MKKQAGLWIDHRKAVIVILTDKGEKITRIKSGCGKQIRFPGGSRRMGCKKQRLFETTDLNRIWGNTLMTSSRNIREAGSIQIFGPGEAKGELVKRLEAEGLKERIVEMKPWTR